MKWDFNKQLELFGPGGTIPWISEADSWRYCRWVAVTHYENFTVASSVLPRNLINHFHAIYAYCRWADDLGDETGGGLKSLSLLNWWRDLLCQCYAGKCSHPVFKCLRQTITKFCIPTDPFHKLISAFEQDQHVKRYQNHQQLLNYCDYSANPVGRLVLHLFQCHSDETGIRSDQICTALQETNFWQDVSRDLQIGRIYLPEDERDQFGYSHEDLLSKRFTPSFANLMKYLVDRTRNRFYLGTSLLDYLPYRLKVDVDLFIRGGLKILEKIESIGYNVLENRPALTKWEKGMMASKSAGLIFSSLLK